MELRAAFAAGHHRAILEALGDLAYLEARCRVSVGALVDDLGYLLRGAPTPLPAEASLLHPSGVCVDRGMIAILETLLLVHADMLTREPGRLFPILHDELFWRDAFRPWAEHARAIFEARPGVCWLRRLRPPHVRAAALPFWRLQGDARALSRDGAHLLLQREGPRHQLLLIDVGTGLARRTFDSDQRIGGRFSPDGTRFVTFSDSTARLWATDSLALIRELGPHGETIWRAVIADDGRVVFTMSGHEVRAWCVADGASTVRTSTKTIEALLPCGPGAVLFQERGTGWWRWDGAAEPTLAADDTEDYLVVAVSPAGDRLVRQRTGAGLEGWGLPEGTRQFQQPVRGYTMSLAFHPSGASFAGNDGILRDATTGDEVRRLPGGSSPYPSFDPRGRFVLTRHEQEARLWDLASGALVAQVRTGRIGDLRAHWSDDGRVLVLGDWRTTLVADVAALAPAPPRLDDVRPVHHAWRTRFSPSGATLVVDHEGGVSFWDVARGAIRAFVDATEQLAFFAGGGRLLARRGDSLIALSTEDGAEVWRITLPRDESERAYVADEVGVLLVEPRNTGDVVALEMEDGRERYRLAGVRVAVHDRDVFLTQRKAGGVSLRATATGAASLVLPDVGEAFWFRISPDRRWLAVYGRDIEVWDLTTRARQSTIRPGESSFRFSDDSATLITLASQSQQSGNQDWNIERVHDVVTGACIGEKGWWDQDAERDPPRQLGPGIFLEADQLEGRTPNGEVFVAITRHGRVELFVVR